MKSVRVLLALGSFLAVAIGRPVAFAAEETNATEKKPAQDLVLKGDAKCTGCHDESDEPVPTMLELHPSVLAIAKTRHGVRADERTPTCTNCHGESEKHLNHKGKDKPPKPDNVFTKHTATSAEARNEACLTCHKGDKRAHWEGSQHATADLACTSCHRVHVQRDSVMDKATQAEVCFNCHKTERAQTHKVSTHPILAGKVACSSCHNPHGSTGPKLMVKNSVNETCYTCHAEKRGPFLFEHSPSNDNCINCHATHGSNTAPLLKTRLPFLCQECHQDHGASLKSGASVVNGTGGLLSGTAGADTTAALVTGTAFGKSPSVQGNGRMCLNCHVMIHGSNAPSGAFFNR